MFSSFWVGSQEAWYSRCQYTIDNVLLSACIIINNKIYILLEQFPFEVALKTLATFKLVMGLNPAILSYSFLSPCLLLRVTITQVGGLLSCVFVGCGTKQLLLVLWRSWKLKKILFFTHTANKSVKQTSISICWSWSLPRGEARCVLPPFKSHCVKGHKVPLDCFMWTQWNIKLNGEDGTFGS